ncbi:unnamed protein product [Ambrosiozyma monospora]|uniref:Unnamed protein product n=1 Tax=Ambrosiozyma monospora TaxID=43982 RepID=A0ACB5T1J9_AMBMO|nr:unnamed protein product [Ambrosiozyma monospora]
MSGILDENPWSTPEPYEEDDQNQHETVQTTTATTISSPSLVIGGNNSLSVSREASPIDLPTELYSSDVWGVPSADSTAVATGPDAATSSVLTGDVWADAEPVNKPVDTLAIEKTENVEDEVLKDNRPNNENGFKDVEKGVSDDKSSLTPQNIDSVPATTVTTSESNDVDPSPDHNKKCITGINVMESGMVSGSSEQGQVINKEEEEEEDDDDDFDDDDFGSFESTEEVPKPTLNTIEPIEQIIANMFPAATTTFNPPSSNKGNDRSILLSKSETSDVYNKITSTNRQFKKSNIPKSQFRSRSYMKSSATNKEVITLAKTWAKTEKGLQVSELNDQTDKHHHQKKLKNYTANVFQWSTKSISKLKKTETASPTSPSTPSPTSSRDPKLQVNQKLLKTAFNESRKMIEARDAELKQLKLKRDRERRERELRLAEEKRKREEEIRKYSMSHGDDFNGAGSDGKSKSGLVGKKTFFGSLFGGKSKIAKDSLSHTQIAAAAADIKDDKNKVTDNSHDDIDFFAELAKEGLHEGEVDDFGDFEGSDDDDESIGYNQLGGDSKKTAKKELKTGEATEDGNSEKKDNGKDVEEENGDDDDDDESFGGFLQTPMDETKPNYSAILSNHW